MRFLADRSGVGVLEYGLIAGLVAMVAIAALLLLGGSASNSLNESAAHLPPDGAAIASPVAAGRAP